MVSHGYHSGLVLPRETMAETASRGGHAALNAVAQRFAGYRSLEIGWGDEGFYRHVPDAASLTFGLAVRALLRPGNPSVVHVVGLPGHPRQAFPRSDIVRIELSGGGWARMLDALEASFSKAEGGAAPEPLGPGLYGPSLFYRGVETFHVFQRVQSLGGAVAVGGGRAHRAGAGDAAAGPVARPAMAGGTRCLAEKLTASGQGREPDTALQVMVPCALIAGPLAGRRRCRMQIAMWRS